MTLRSMTGFGTATAECDGVRATWELRAVNGKGLDLRFRIPPSLEQAEAGMRALARKALARGNVQIALSIEGDDAAPVPEIDQAALDRVVADARAIAERHDLAMPDAGGFLSMRGVMRAPDAAGDLRAGKAAEAAAAQAVRSLVEDRQREGAALAEAIGGRIDAIERLTQRAQSDPSRTAEAIRGRLARQIEALGETGLDRDRLYAEAALLAVRADLAEELDRLTAHVAAARELLASDEPVGRRFEFLTQEFGREANTLCAKSNAASLTAIGLELKVAIDQLREQVANVE